MGTQTICSSQEAPEHRAEWEPLFSDETRCNAIRNIVGEIVSALAACPGMLNENIPMPNAENSLSMGRAGVALFLAYAHAICGSELSSLNALQYLNAAIDAVGVEPMPPQFYGGFSGIAWATEHLKKLLNDPSDDTFSDVDNAVIRYLRRAEWIETYDLISGLVGYGVYALERLPSPAGYTCLELIVDKLERLAEKSLRGITWFTSPRLLSPMQRETSPNGHYNCGLAHGTPGVIALLGEIYRAGVSRPKTQILLEGAVTWLLSQKLPEDQCSTFPSFITPEQGEVTGTRLAWCYGDPGVAAALFSAGRCTGNSCWEEEALETIRKAAARGPSKSRVVDACLCHGAAGVAHIYNRFYQATREEAFKHAARYWYDRTLAFHNPGTGVAGYTVYTMTSNGERGFTGRIGLLEGSAGVGLALLAAISNQEPKWDRFLLTDLPWTSQ